MRPSVLPAGRIPFHEGYARSVIVVTYPVNNMSGPEGPLICSTLSQGLVLREVVVTAG